MFSWWKLYYADGTRFTSLDGAWTDAPAIGAVAFKAALPDGTYFMQCGADAIWWDGVDAFVYNLDLPAPFLPLAAVEAAAGRLKYGIAVPNWAELSATIRADFSAP
jgi:hypothetical protein